MIPLLSTIITAYYVANINLITGENNNDDDGFYQWFLSNQPSTACTA